MNREQQTHASSIMQKLYAYGFALDEANLFLDTHPDDCEARAYFIRMRDAYLQAKAEYVEEIGPLCMKDVDAIDRWTWVDDPWPWEGGRC